MSDPKTYRIVSFQAENIKRISAVEITPTGNLVEITGKNRQGKSSILDAIWWALGGATNVQAQPIRKGEDKGFVTIDLGGIRVTRTFTKDKEGPGFTTSLRIENAEGMVAQKPQALLDQLVGKLAFDLGEFENAAPKDQAKMLQGLVPGVDFDAMDAASKKDFAARTEVNRTVGTLRAQLGAFTLPEVLPEPMDEAAILAELEGASAHNAEIERRRSARTMAGHQVDAYRRNAEERRAQAAALIAEAEAAEKEANDLAAKVAKADPLPDPVDPSALSAKLQDARRVSEVLTAAKAKATLQDQLTAAEAEAAALTNAMAERTERAAKAIKDAKLPVEGLALGDGLVMLDGLPFDQASDADRLRVSVALAAAMNPRLRVARVREGSKFDSETLAMVAKLAEEHDIQVWVETVDSGRPQAVVIVDGHVQEG